MPSNSSEDVVTLTKKVDDLNRKVDELNAKVSKLEDMDCKIDKISQNSQKIAESSEVLVAAQKQQKATEIAKTSVYSPTSFVAKELTDYVLKTLEKHNTTNFRRWLTTVGRTVVQKAIESYVQQKVPLLNWYDTKVTDLGNDIYHYHAKGAFPVSIDTGVPFIGRVELTKVELEVDTDVNNVTKEAANQKYQFKSSQETKRVFAMFVAVISLIMDILYAFIDPRIRYG